MLFILSNYLSAIAHGATPPVVLVATERQWVSKSSRYCRMLLSVWLGTEKTAPLLLCSVTGNMLLTSGTSTSVCLVSSITLCQIKKKLKNAHWESESILTTWTVFPGQTLWWRNKCIYSEGNNTKVQWCDRAETLAVPNIKSSKMSLGEVSESKQWVGAQLGIAMVWLYNPLFGQISLPGRHRSQGYI